uniref:Uncharacterized protein n=1 Tax=Anguilla anguilla TaxID=7936 RepID=A0A0E9UVY8_ANGAN
MQGQIILEKIVNCTNTTMESQLKHLY